MMKRIYFIFFTMLLFFNCEKPKEEIITPPPNIILILADDLGWGDTGFNGNAIIKTPHLDALAAQGIIMSRFYAASTVCSPTRASVLTGRHPSRMNIHYANNGSLPKEEITLPEILKEKGYLTGHFGKWHLGILTTNEKDANRGGREKFAHEFSIPSMHGYDNYFCTESKVPTYDPMLKPTIFDSLESLRYGWKARTMNDSTKYFGTAYWEGEKQKVTTNLLGEDTKIIMDRALPFIQKAVSNKKPFFTTIWPHTPHLPVVADSIHRTVYQDMTLREQLYYGAITAMDKQIGRLWEKLNELGVAENTIIFFASDNGPEINTPGSSASLRGRKRDLYEGGVRVPAFAVWKNKWQGGQEMTSPVVTSDYLPTILEVLGIDYSSERPLDGVSLIKQFQNLEAERKVPIGFIYKEGLLRTWNDDKFKLVSYNGGKNFALYDIVEDAGETTDISLKKLELVEAMKARLNGWMESVERSGRGDDYNYNRK